LGEPLDIQRLTRLMVAGDETAYRNFFDAYYDRLSRYLLVVATGNEDAMREALQATLVRVVRHIRIFSEEASFWSWLKVLARSAFLDETRKRHRYFAFLDRFKLHANIENDLAQVEQTEQQLNRLLEQSIAGLSGAERELVRWKYDQRRSVRDIAAELETTEKSIESRLARIRQKIKNHVVILLKHEAND
jgi:RNA polymerase sigma-70 factor (ECF subfamily)